MAREAPNPRDCRCGAVPGGLHVEGCDKERCAICGGQLIGCDCVYVLSGIDVNSMEREHPEIFCGGPTEEMYVSYDAEVARLGGRLPWDGEYPGSKAAREFGLWCRMIPGRGLTPCGEDHPDAREDLNRLSLVAEWDRDGRRWVRRAN